MKKHFLFPALALVSILLCAFTIAPAPRPAADPSMAVRFTTDFSSDGSGKLSFELELSREMMALLKSAPGFDEENTCATFFESAYDDWEISEKNLDGALTCAAETAFKDLDEYETLVEGDLGGAEFTRLEIDGGHLYYDLMPKVAGSSIFGELESGAGFDIEANWILNMPGEVVDTNADEKSGQTLTWNLLEMNASSHIRAESKTGGSGLLGLDPTLTILAVIGLLGCCCLVILIAGGAAFFFLRRKKTAPTAA
ncbi:MAG: hypothetical protein WBM17_16675 [Anaerolineales bacterium]